MLLAKVVGALLFGTLAVFDLRFRRLPNWLLLFCAAWGLVVVEVPLDFRLMATALVLVLFWPAWQTAKLGGGDVKLLAVLGFIFGVEGFLTHFFWGAVALGVMALVQLLLHQGNLSETGKRILYRLPLRTDLTLPFGVPFALSTALIILFR